MCHFQHHLNIKWRIDIIPCICVILLLIDCCQIYAEKQEKESEANQQKHSSFTFNLLQPDINDKIIRLDDSSGLSKQWNTTTNTDSTIQPNFQHQYVSKSRVIGSNILNGNMKNEIMKEKNHRQYHLSKRKLLSILSLHSSTESSVYTQPLRSSSNKTDEHITQLENVNPQKEPFGEKSTNKNRSSLHNLKGPSALNPPTFQTDFEAHVRVTNVHSGEVYVVRERVENKRVTLKMYRYTEEKPHLCIYSRSSGFGHTVYGLECLPTVNLPTGCFCTSGPTPTPYIPLVDILEEISSKGAPIVNDENEETIDCSNTQKDFSQFECWQVKENNQDIKSLFMEQDHVVRSINKVKQRMASTFDVASKGFESFKTVNYGDHGSNSDTTKAEKKNNYAQASDNGSVKPNLKSKTELVPLQIVISRNTSNPNYFTQREALCGDVQLKYTILRFIPKSHDYAKEDESNSKDVNRVAPNSDIIDIHYGHTSNTNGIIKENNEQVSKKDDYQSKDSNEFGLSPMNNRVQGSWQTRRMEKEKDDYDDWSKAPEGIYCQRPDIFRRRLPELPEQFSVAIESVDETHNTVSYTEQHYDAKHNLVSFRFAPRTHSPSAIFFARFIMSTTFP